MFNLVLKFVRLQPVLVMLPTSHQVRSSTNLNSQDLKIYEKLTKRIKLLENQFLVQSVSQQLCITDSNFKFNSVSVVKQLGRSK